MTAIAPPRMIEALLEASAPGSEFRDSIIGDLAQEFATRAERYSPRAARLWYYREAIRTAPHLARHWVAGAGWKEARRQLNIVGLTYVLTTMVQGLVGFGVMALLPDTARFPAPNLVVFSVLALVQPILAGFIAATLDDRAPMIGAGVTAVAAAVTATILWLTFALASGPVLLVHLIRVPIMIAGILYGASIRVRLSAVRGRSG